MKKIERRGLPLGLSGLEWIMVGGLILLMIAVVSHAMDMQKVEPEIE